MICEPIRSVLFYLAEDDPSAAAELEAHLMMCSSCAKEWQEYRAALDFYQTTSPTATPVFRPRRTDWKWRITRIAAVLLFGTSMAFLFPRLTHLPGGRASLPAVGLPGPAQSWEPPVVTTPSVTFDSRDLDFSTRVETLRTSIARLQSQTSANKF